MRHDPTISRGVPLLSGGGAYGWGNAGTLAGDRVGHRLAPARQNIRAKPLVRMRAPSAPAFGRRMLDRLNPDPPKQSRHSALAAATGQVSTSIGASSTRPVNPT